MRLLYLVLASVLLFGCIFGPPITKISEIKANPEKYLGEQVTVQGTVKNSFRLGNLSGFTLEGDGTSILVSSAALPAEGSNATVSGTLMKEFVVGYYILAKDVH